MKFRALLAFLILLFMTACNGTFAIGLEHSVNNTTPLAPAVTDTLSPGIPVLPTDILPAATATFSPSNTPLPAATAILVPSTCSHNYCRPQPESP